MFCFNNCYSITDRCCLQCKFIQDLRKERGLHLTPVILYHSGLALTILIHVAPIRFHISWSLFSMVFLLFCFAVSLARKLYFLGEIKLK